MNIVGLRPVTFCSGYARHPRFRHRRAFVKAGQAENRGKLGTIDGESGDDWAPNLMSCLLEAF